MLRVGEGDKVIGGIAIIGLNGSGKSTLAHALAKRINYYELDVEDCYFPEQKESRIWALENNSIMETVHLGELPFSKPRTKTEVQDILIEKIANNPKFILSGVTMNWKEDILACLDIAFWIQTPGSERVKRIQAREAKRFGKRVLAEGDMFEQQREFLKMAENRDSKIIEESIKKLACPVVKVDGTLPVLDILERIMEELTL